MDIAFVALGWILIGLGSAVSLVGLVWHWIESFKTGTGWGIACVLGPFCLCLIPNLIWLAMNWAEGWRPLLLYFAAWIIPSAVGLMLVVGGGLGA